MKRIDDAGEGRSGRSAPHPLRSYALSGVTSVQTNSLNPKLTAAITEPSLNAELGCIKVVDTFRGCNLEPYLDTFAPVVAHLAGA